MTEKIEPYGKDIEVLPKKGMPSIQKASPTDLLEILINKGADLATLEKFMDLKDREEKTMPGKHTSRLWQILNQTHRQSIKIKQTASSTRNTVLLMLWLIRQYLI